MNSKLQRALSIISKIESAVPIDEYLKKDLNIKDFKPAGQKNEYPIYMCKCPLHQEKTPSFAIYKYNDTYYCFGCGQSGGVFSLARKINNFSFAETVKYFINNYNIQIEEFDDNYDDNNINFDNLLEETYKQTILPDENSKNNVNSYISQKCKKYYKKFLDLPEIVNIIEKIYKITDYAVENNNKYLLFLLKNEVMKQAESFFLDIENKILEIKSIIKENKNCSACFLRYGANNIVCGDGNCFAKILLIGEAPGKTEDEQGIPFVGTAGKLLRNTIEKLGYDQKNFWFDNVCCCRPKDNIFMPNEAKICKKNWLIKKISIIKPDAIILFGNNAARTFMENDTLSISNKIKDEDEIVIDNKKIKIYYNYHPSFICRNGGESENNKYYNIFLNKLRDVFTKFLSKEKKK